MTELILGFDRARAIAYRDGTTLTQGEFVADVLRTAERLPDAGFTLNLCEDRYNLLVAFGAAVARGQVSLFPNSGAPAALEQIRALYPGAHLVYDGCKPPVAMRAIEIQCSGGEPAGQASLPDVVPDRPLIHAFTSGSTGTPQPSVKTWRALVAGASQLERRAGDPRARWRAIVATVPSLHSYGLETTIVPALLSGCAIDCGRPLFPADVKAALERIPEPRGLITTPLHLKALIASSVTFPPIGLVMCATAPLSIDLARQAESRLQTRVLEIYGCTESGYVATRWTADGGDWVTRDDMQIQILGERHAVAADFLSAPVVLADVLETDGGRNFRLIGRSSDMVNIAGKRASLSGMSQMLMKIEGVEDGVILVPESNDESEVRRLVAVVVAPGLLEDHIRQAFRQLVDPVFVPRQVIIVDMLPRNETGKLPLDELRSLVNRAV